MIWDEPSRLPDDRPKTNPPVRDVCAITRYGKADYCPTICERQRFTWRRFRTRWVPPIVHNICPWACCIEPTLIGLCTHVRQPFQATSDIREDSRHNHRSQVSRYPSIKVSRYPSIQVSKYPGLCTDVLQPFHFVPYQPFPFASLPFPFPLVRIGSTLGYLRISRGFTP